MRRVRALLVSVMLSCMFAVVSQAAYYCTSPGVGENTKTEGTWENTDQGRRFTGADGQVYVNHWLYWSNGHWYCFDENGYALKGFQTVEGKRRFFDLKWGYMEQNFFVTGGYLYYADSDTGEIMTSQNGGNDHPHSFNKVKYVFDEEGHATNPDGQMDELTRKKLGQKADGTKTWAKEGVHWRYYENGARLINAWHQEGGHWYYFDQDGNMMSNCVKEIDGVKYHFNSDGNMNTSGRVQDEAGNAYTANADGSLTPVDMAAEKAAKEAQEKLDHDYGVNDMQQALNKVANPYNDNAVVQWFNATYAILTRGNGQNIRAVGGILKTAGVGGRTVQMDESNSDEIRRLLVSNWGVTDRASADSVLESLIAGGNATGSAWDYSRAMSNLGYYYIAGYYTIEETLDQSLRVANIIQTKFTSWDEFVNSYLAGYAAWSGEGTESRREIYENLKGSAFNPYSLDWNMNLTKTW